MPFDKSEPRVGLIFRIGFLSVIILIAIRAALMSYFDNIASAEEQRKFGDIAPTALMNLRADEDLRLKSGPEPIDKAMADMVAHGRMGASPDIMPSASRDLGPMQGWMKMPNAVPGPMMAAPIASDTVVPSPSAAPDLKPALPHMHPPLGPVAPPPPPKKKPAKTTTP